MARPKRIDWSDVDWTRTNAEIALSLGGLRRETVARARVKHGQPKVYPRFLPRIAELERENAELRAALAATTASPIMDAVRARPGLEHVHVNGTDAELLLTLLRSRHGWEPDQPRWSHVRLLSGHGSTVGHALCIVAGLDPNECAPRLDEENCSRCGSYLLDRDDDASEDDEEAEDDAPEDAA